MFAAIGSKTLPLGLQKSAVFDISKFPRGEIGSICLPEVLIGSNGLPKYNVRDLVDRQFEADSAPVQRLFGDAVG